MGLDNGPGGTEPTASIDPEALDTLITDAEDAAEDVESFASTYRGRFNTYDVSTSNIAQMEQVAEWVRDQIPMLTRRRELAQVAADQSGDSFVTAGAGEITWDTGEEAADAGREDAERLLDDIGPGDEIPQEVYDLLREHNQDPDYVEAFFGAAGPGTLQAFQIDAATGDFDEPYDPGKMVYLSNALATASRRMDEFTDEEWLLEQTGQPDPWGAMVPFMEYGHWGEDFLHAMADRLTFFTHTDSQVTVIDALSRNPVAAANWYQGSPPEERGWDTNAELVTAIMGGNIPMLDQDALHESITRMLDSAMVDAGRFDQDLADQSVLTLLEGLDGLDGDPVVEHYQPWLGDVAERHIDDIYDSVTSPIPTYFEQLRGDRDGVEAPAELWASLTEQAMYDQETAGYLSVVFQQKHEDEVGAHINMESNEHRDANGLTLEMTDQFAGWFLQRGENVREQLELDVEEWNSRVEEGIDLLWNAATDPKKLVKDLAVDSAKDLAASFLKKDEPDWDVDTGWASDKESRIHLFTTEMYNNSGGATLEPVTIVLERDEDGNVVRERTYDGDPQEYQDRYGGDFIKDGEIMDFDEIAKDDKALQAYMEWLQDPAVQQWVYPNYGTQNPGGN